MTALREACGTATPAGTPLPTSKNLACADELLSNAGATGTLAQNAGTTVFAHYLSRRAIHAAACVRRCMPSFARTDVT